MSQRAIMPPRPSSPTVPANAPVFAGVAVLSAADQAERLTVCRSGVCVVSVDGKCKGCCGGGTPHEVIVKLNVSICVKKLWKK